MKLKSVYTFPFLLLAILLISCNSEKKIDKNNVNHNAKNEAFSIVDGVKFYEVKRRFKNGLSFNEIGFQQEPTWIIQFKGPDTMLAYSPEKQGMEAFYLQYDHGEVYNFAREFFRAKTITKDSIVLQRLQVNGRQIAGDDDERSDVYCTYYTKNYIENVLKTTIGELQKPSKRDTAFINMLVERTKKDPSNPEIAFAARQPVVFSPNSKNVKAEQISTVDELNKRHKSVDYMYPNYRLEINKSYKNFNYSFTAIVDHTGKIHINSVEGVLEEDKLARKKLLQGIANVYLQNLFFIKPGSTLGMPHASEVTINLVGKM